jgi:hypothetical protein
MEVSFADSFKKAYKKRIKSTNTEPEFWTRLELFTNDPFDQNSRHINSLED